MSGAASNQHDFIPPPPGETLGHPRPLWMLFGAEFWERFAYYGMRALLAVYVAAQFFSHLPEGEAKADAFHRVLDGEDLPAGRVVAERVTWLVSRPLAARG